MGSSPVRVGIFAGEGESRRRVGSQEALELEAKGVKITRTALDNPNIEEGEQQIENLGETYADIDARMQRSAEGKETLDPSEVNYRKPDKPNLMISWMSDGPVTVEDAEKTIRKHENLKGGNPMVIEGSRGESSRKYRINGKEISEEEYKELVKKSKNKSSSKSNKSNKPKPPKIEGDMYSKENQAKLKEYFKLLEKNKNKK